METGRVSIVVPVYNVENYLKRCINSVLMQSYEIWELILVDDGSSDKSGIICDEYARKDPRIRVIHTVNRGVSSARNSGIELASGEYILFADADDWLEKEMLDTLVSAIIRNGSESACCDVYYVMADKNGNEEKVPRNKWGRYTNECCIEGKEIYRAFFVNSGTLWNKIFKIEVIQGKRFDISQRYGEDTEYLLELMPQIKKVTIIPYYGYNYFINREGNVISADVDERSLEFIEIAKKIYNQLKDNDMGSIGVYRIYAAITQILKKIPANDKYNKKWKRYYTEAKKALRYPSLKDKVSFILDNRIEKKIKLEYCIKLMSPKYGNMK